VIITKRIDTQKFTAPLYAPGAALYGSENTGIVHPRPAPRTTPSSVGSISVGSISLQTSGKILHIRYLECIRLRSEGKRYRNI